MRNNIEELMVKVKLKGGTLYYVGGYVRDTLLKRPINDIDLLVTGLSEDELKSIIEPMGAIYIGKSFGVFKLDDMDIALPRIETSTGDKHTDFITKFGKTVTLKEDLGRRDFTINAMAINVETNKLIDFHGGENDLQNRVIRHVSDNSISDDFLRALRGIQFCARFGFHLHKTTFAEIIQNRNLLSTISQERIRDEINKLLLAPREGLITGIQYLKNLCLIGNIFPELEFNDVDNYNYIYHKFNTHYHTLESLKYTEDDLELRLACLLHDVGKYATEEWDADTYVYTNVGHSYESRDIAKVILTKLKYDNKTIENVSTLIFEHMVTDTSIKSLRKIISRIGYTLTVKLIKLHYADRKGTNFPMLDEEFINIMERIKKIYKDNNAVSVKDLQINGHDLLKLGYIGKDIGLKLQELLDKVIIDPNINTKPILLSMVEHK